jgi:hypothetical protein
MLFMDYEADQVCLCECRSSTYSRYYDASALERVRLGPFMGRDERVVGHAKTLGSLWLTRVLRLSIYAVIGFRASVSDCDVEH